MKSPSTECSLLAMICESPGGAAMMAIDGNARIIDDVDNMILH